MQLGKRQTRSMIFLKQLNNKYQSLDRNVPAKAFLCSALILFQSLPLRIGDDDDDDDCDCDDDCCCDDEYDDDEDAMYECVCPNCGDTIMLGENIIADGSIDCPNCGESLEFDFSEIEDEDNED